MSTILKTTFAGALWAGCAITTAVAANYPERPVRVIVAAAPGAAPDVGARIVAAELTRQMGRQFVVDNRPGAGGSIGTEMIAHAPPDGYTIGNGTTSTLAINRSILSTLSYEPDRDLQPIVQTTMTPFMLAVAQSLPVKSVQELIEYARKNPGKLLFPSTGNGSVQHLAGALFRHMTSTQITHVPYKGIQQGIAEMIGGQVHLTFDTVPSIGPHVRAGRVRGLAVATATRLSSYPELPTFAECGMPSFELTTWSGIIAPRGVSVTVVNRLNSEVNRALASSTVKEKFFTAGTAPAGGTPQEFGAFIKREVGKWAGIIKDANIKAD
jgi:tripartite-type tricarboxylate transporter receptor subunit TctC